MKRMSLILALLLLCLCCSSTLADDGRACAKVTADLLDAPNARANVMMRYYIGTRVEVVREVDDAYVQVNVGKPGGSLMGYMEKRDLAFGEKAIRQVRAEAVSYTAEVGARCKLYSYPDKLAPVSDEAFDINCKSVLGYRQGDWLHVDDGLGHTGFVARDEIVLTGPDYQYADIIYVERAEDEENAFIIEAPWLERILRQTDVSDYESLQYFQRALRDSGIIDRLEEMGVKQDDSIYIGEYQFDYIV